MYKAADHVYGFDLDVWLYGHKHARSILDSRFTDALTDVMKDQTDKQQGDRHI